MTYHNTLLCLCNLDGLVQRRIELRAQYKMECSLLDDQLFHSTVQDSAARMSAGVTSIIYNNGITKASQTNAI